MNYKIEEYVKQQNEASAKNTSRETAKILLKKKINIDIIAEACQLLTREEIEQLAIKVEEEKN